LAAIAYPLRTLEMSPTINPMLRTTTAPTIFQAGTKDNVLQLRESGHHINFRIRPGDTVATS
jgi:carboxypeptidase PM20D1